MILAKLKKSGKIDTPAIEKILLKHGVNGDVDALQHAHRLTLAQRLMASLRDEEGKREVFAVRGKKGYSEYIVVDLCGEEKDLKAIKYKLRDLIPGLEKSIAKVSNRLARLRHFFSQS